MTTRLIVLLCGLAMPAVAQDLRLPGNAVQTHDHVATLDSHDFATGAWAAGAVPMITAEGRVKTSAWRIAASGITTLQMLRPLREQLSAAGFETVFDCQTRNCGGFDFRFAVDVLPPPDMQVDLSDFRYLLARKPSETGDNTTGILISRTAQAGFVQIVQVGPAQSTTSARGRVLSSTDAVEPLPSNAPKSIEDALTQTGRAVLDDLAFETGSATLSAGQYPSLQALADLLSAQPELTIALVGHTDSSGSLDSNIVLSKRRAGSVLERLVSEYDIPRRQLEAQGMGYLSPIANNQTDEGRDANRRVEAIITSTE